MFDCTVLKDWNVIDVAGIALALVCLAALAYFAYQIIG
jgi:hypothetical protein